MNLQTGTTKRLTIKRRRALITNKLFSMIRLFKTLNYCLEIRLSSRVRYLNLQTLNSRVYLNKKLKCFNLASHSNYCSSCHPQQKVKWMSNHRLCTTAIYLTLCNLLILMLLSQHYLTSKQKMLTTIKFRQSKRNCMNLTHPRAIIQLYKRIRSLNPYQRN